MGGISIVTRAWHALTNKRHFWQRFLSYALLGRSKKPEEWLRFRHAAVRLCAIRDADEGPLPTLAFGDVFPEARDIFATVALVPPTPYGISWEETVALSIMARAIDARVIIEFGTFDGRTTLHLAENASPTATVHSIDIQKGRFSFGSDAPYFADLEVGHLVRGEKYEKNVVLHTGDTRTFDWTPFVGRAEFVFVDGDHSYGGVVADSEVASRLVAAGGVVVWHDYCVVEDVTRALLELSRSLPLVHLKGTSLVVWRARPSG